MMLRRLINELIFANHLREMQVRLDIARMEMFHAEKISNSAAVNDALFKGSSTLGYVSNMLKQYVTDVRLCRK